MRTEEQRAYQKEWKRLKRINDPEWAAKDRARRYAWQKQKLADDPAYAEKQKIAKRSARYRKLYGISHEQFVEMYTRQVGRCAVCRKEILPSGCNTHVDHCHTTGRVRELLCGNCNKVLGLVKEDAETLGALAAYLEKHRGDAE